MSVTKESILKGILLREFDRMQPLISTFEDDPMQFMLRKYVGLNKTLTYLMTPSFQDYITGIYIVAPKPTTFKIVLHNGQFFFLQFTGKTYQATVAGKSYYLMNIGEKERCMLAIARLLRFGNPLKTKGPEGAEQGTREGGEEGGGETGGGEEAPSETPEEGGGEEETIAEAKILEEVLKKKLSEDQDLDSKKDTKKYEIAAANKLNAQIEEIKKNSSEGEKSITIVVNQISYPNIVKAEVVPGTLNKSDINLVDSKGNPVIFISHKDVGGSKRFARWGSFQYLYGSNTEVDNFRDNIYNYILSNISSGVRLTNATINKNNQIIFYSTAAFSQKISSDDLKKKLVFGSDFGKIPSLNNVQLVVQGDIVLKEYDNKPGFYEFDVSKAENVWFNGDLPTGDYEPVLHVHYRGESKSRGSSHNELDIINCETMAKPIAAASGILWEAGFTLNAKNKYIPKNAIIIPKGEGKFLSTGKEREILVAKNWYENFIQKQKNKHKKPEEYNKYFDLKDNSFGQYLKIKPHFRKYFYLSSV